MAGGTEENGADPCDVHGYNLLSAATRLFFQYISLSGKRKARAGEKNIANRRFLKLGFSIAGYDNSCKDEQERFFNFFFFILLFSLSPEKGRRQPPLFLFRGAGLRLSAKMLDWRKGKVCAETRKEFPAHTQIKRF